MDFNHMCKAYGCSEPAQTTVINEHGEWSVCMKHINAFDVWDESRAAPTDWEWQNGGLARFDFYAGAGVLPSCGWVMRVGGQHPDRYSEVYRWLLEHADHVAPHLNKRLMKEYIRLYFRYAEFGINTFDEHFRELARHPLFDAVEFMKVFLQTIMNHELGRRTLRQMIGGPCKPLVYMNEDSVYESQYHPGVMDAYTAVRKEEKCRWRNEMKSRLAYKEDLMMSAWHPCRIERWIEAGWEEFMDW